MSELQQLRAEHAGPVLDFELANRAYFASFITERSDAYFQEFSERFGALLAEQQAGVAAYHVLVDTDGSILGRFNLIFAADHTAELGYRVAQRCTGRGVATATVRELCRLAGTRYQLRAIRAATSTENFASQKVLRNAGFLPTGPADPDCLGGKSGSWYERVLSRVPESGRAWTSIAARLRHVRWIAGGTGAGKSTAAAALAARFEVEVYDGDRAEHDWLARCSPQQHPHLAAAGRRRPGDGWRDRSPEQAFASMAGLHGETIGLLADDLLTRPGDRPILVDYFGVLPRDLAALLSWPGQAVFLIPTPAFRRSALSRRYADPDRARANWGQLDPARTLQARLARDSLWDAQVEQEATALGLPLITIDGSRSVAELADDLADRFRLGPGG